MLDFCRFLVSLPHLFKTVSELTRCCLIRMRCMKWLCRRSGFVGFDDSHYYPSLPLLVAFELTHQDLLSLLSYYLFFSGSADGASWLQVLFLSSNMVYFSFLYPLPFDKIWRVYIVCCCFSTLKRCLKIDSSSMLDEKIIVIFHFLVFVCFLYIYIYI